MKDNDTPGKYFYNNDYDHDFNVTTALFAIANELYRLRLELQTEPRTIESALINLESSVEGIRQQMEDRR